jgi:hypothetical protein
MMKWEEQGLNDYSGEGSRLIICHAGYAAPGCEPYSKSKSSTDYHMEINSETFNNGSLTTT